jgi:hypothetical protein
VSGQRFVGSDCVADVEEGSEACPGTGKLAGVNFVPLPAEHSFVPVSGLVHELADLRLVFDVVVSSEIVPLSY